MSGREKPLILQNGMPIPQAYDKDLGDWTEYSTEHIKAIKAELALVKAELQELQEIKANQLSGDQKVTLSGTMAVDVIANAISLPPQTWTSWLDIPAGKHCVLLVVCDQPWKMDTNTLRGGLAHEGAYLTHMYPDRFTSPQTPALDNYAAPVVVGMFAKESADILTAAQNVITPPNFRVIFKNESADNVATLRVRMITWGVA